MYKPANYRLHVRVIVYFFMFWQLFIYCSFPFRCIFINTFFR